MRASLVLLLTSLWPVACPAADLYVSPTGRDTNTGRSPSAALHTIQAAVDRLGPGDTCRVLPGVYRETVRFPRSGAAGRPITLEPYGKGEVVISGCDPVRGFVREQAGVWSAPMGWDLGTGRNQVFQGGRVLVEARTPNVAAPGLVMPVAGLSPLWPTFGAFSIPSAQAPGRITSDLLKGQPADYWKGAIYYGLHYEGWCGQTGVVVSSKEGEIQVGDRTETWWFAGSGGSEDGRGMLVGVRHALDQPGEWVVEQGRLLLIPLGGTPSGVEAKRRQLALDLSGREHITVRGIHTRAASAKLDGSAWCTFEGCDLEYISHFTRQYSMGQVDKGRDTTRSGETGIYVSGHDNRFLGCTVRYSAGAGFHLRGYHHTIHNCLIDQVSYTAHYLNAITDAVGDFGQYENLLVGGHVITYNTMRNAGRHFFNFYGNGTSFSSRTRSGMDYMATLFAHNHLYNGMLQTRDAGFLTGFYCSAGTLNGLNSLVTCNVLHDCFDLSAIRWNILGPIYLDAGTANVDVRRNLLWAAPGALQKGVWFNTCCTNCSDVDNTFHRYFQRRSDQLVASDFPNGRPFRFGHDFSHPPAVPAWPPIETRSLTGGASADIRDGKGLTLRPPAGGRPWQTLCATFTTPLKSINTDATGRASPRHRNPTDPLVLEVEKREGASTGVGAQWTFINNVTPGAWVLFKQVPLGQGYRRLRAVYGKVTAAPAQVEVRLDAPDGPLVAAAPLKPTDRPRRGNIQIYREALAPVSPAATGLHDVYIRFVSSASGPVGEFEYFRFEQYRGTLPLKPGDVEIEVRAGGERGPKLGTLYPRGANGSPMTLVAPLEPAPAGTPLCLVVRSAISGTVGTLSNLRVMRASGNPVPAGVGAAPLRDGRGRLALPAQTNLPLYRPSPRVPGTDIPAAGLALWLDAAMPGAIERDAAGHVARWKDRSASHRDAVQADPAFRPSYVAAHKGSPASVRFNDAALTRMEIPDVAQGRTDATLFAVVANREPCLPQNHDARILTASDGVGLDYLEGLALTVPGTETGGPRILTGTFKGRSAGHVRLGCFSPMYQTFFRGEVCEVIAYTRELGPDEIEQVRAYLSARWRLAE